MAKIEPIRQANKKAITSTRKYWKILRSSAPDLAYGILKSNEKLLCNSEYGGTAVGILSISENLSFFHISSTLWLTTKVHRSKISMAGRFQTQDRQISALAVIMASHTADNC
uniref:Uncharacterized protein n=1 Tax=Romanomermis culicivorax TaxID=13658 RepID=A0A915HWN5_ROMCU